MDIDFELIRGGLIALLLLLASVSLHEWAHAFMADKLGDDTPRADGRVTLNPASHMDLWGTLIVPIVNIFLFRNLFTFIAWGRPVDTNPSNFSRRTRDIVLVAAAGPAMNLLIALVAVVVGAYTVLSVPRLAFVVNLLVTTNVGLAVFNMLPLPPLDGASLLRPLVGMTEEMYLRLSQWSGILLLLFLNLPFTVRLIQHALNVVAYPLIVLCFHIRPEAAELIFAS